MKQKRRPPRQATCPACCTPFPGVELPPAGTPFPCCGKMLVVSMGRYDLRPCARHRVSGQAAANGP